MLSPSNMDLDTVPTSSIDAAILNSFASRQSEAHPFDPRTSFSDPSLRHQSILLGVILSVLFPGRPHYPPIDFLRVDGVFLMELYNAYRSGSFAHFRTHPSVLSLLKQVVPSNGMLTSSSGTSLNSASMVKFEGNYHLHFVDIVRKYAVASGVYCRLMVVIQCSGMGKSRMVQEASLDVFTISVNICKEPPAGQITYPPPDVVVRNFFATHERKSDEQIQVEYTWFLHVMFEHAMATIDKHDLGKDGQLAEQWSEFMMDGQTSESVGPNRATFFEEVVTQTQKLIQSERTTPLWEITALLRATCLKMTDKIEEINKQNKRKNDSICLVSFDEPHGLIVPRNPARSDLAKSPYHNFEKVLNKIKDYTVFFVFLSKNSHLQRYAPLGRIHPSMRTIRESFLHLFPPYTELPFDVFAKDHLKNLGMLTLRKVCTIETMVSFGRPLWKTAFVEYLKQNDSTGREEAAKHVLRLAAHKLDCAIGYAGYVERPKDDLHLAAIGIRVGLTFEASNLPARELVSRLVERHMRVVTVIPEHRDYMWTCAPSEPVLAQAAANKCKLDTEAPWLLHEYFARGIIAGRERGEIIGRLLWTCAHDQVIKNMSSTAPHIYHQPIKLIDLLKCLFNRKWHDNIMEAKPVGNSQGLSLKDVFKNAYVHFSHFALAGNAEMLQVGEMYAALIRGMALQCPQNQESIDFVIPVHMGGLDEEISPDRTTAINVQVKNRSQSRSTPIDRSITVPNSDVPALSIIMELGSTPKGKQPVYVKSGTKANRVFKDDPSYHDKHHYVLIAHGHESNTYKVIPEGNKVYSGILCSESMIQDFPRADVEGHIDSIYDLKPCFEGGEKSHTHGWFNPSALS